MGPTKRKTYVWSTLPFLVRFGKLRVSGDGVNVSCPVLSLTQFSSS